MKTLLMILGGQAVGKMTVGEAIAEKTKLKLFHNHMTVELANHFYGFGSHDETEESMRHKASFSDLRDRLRLVVFDNLSKSFLPGVIFTGAMYYDNEKVWQIMDSYIETFKTGANSIGEDIRLLIVELNCDISERFIRNVSENRLAKKPSKSNVKWTKENIEYQENNRRIKANEDDIKRFNANGFLSIDNTNISASDVADMIIKHFGI